jgi:hypothetical protein
MSGAASSPVSFDSSQISQGRSSFRSSLATTPGDSDGDSSAGTAPIRESAQVSSAMSTLSDL